VEGKSEATRGDGARDRAGAQRRLHHHHTDAGARSQCDSNLKAAAAVTHNPQYVETIEALERDGINNPRNLSRAGDERFLRKVDHLRRNGKIIAGKHHRMSDLEACECVVAEWGLGALGTSFEVEVERLRKAWIRSRRPT
jgi:hypothetical protein